MVAIDHAFAGPLATQTETPHSGQLVLFALAASAMLAAGALALNAANASGWHVAAEMVSRFSVLIFAAGMIVEPLARLVPVPAMQAIAREHGSLILAFAAATIMSLACTVAPFELSGNPVPATTVAYSVLTGAIVVVMLFSANPATIRLFGRPAWRAMQRIAIAYFWLAFTLAGIEHLVGPHRPDSWNGFALLLLLGALLVRFADSFVANIRRPRLAEKVA